jgi:hypothetical protein
VVDPEPDVQVPDIPAQDTGTPSERIIPGIASGRQAKDWLMSNIEGVTTKELNNNDMIRQVAKKNLVIFPDWV